MLDIESCRKEIREKTIKYSPSNCVNFDETSVTPYAGENYSYQVDLADGSSMYDDKDIHEPDIIIDDYEIPTSSQSMTNELLCLDLNDSFSERRNSISINRNLKHSFSTKDCQIFQIQRTHRSLVQRLRILLI